MGYPVQKDYDFGLTEFEERLGRLRAVASSAGFDWVFLTTEENVRYFTGVASGLFKADHERAVSALIPTNEHEESFLVAPEFLEGVCRSKSWIERLYLSSEVNLKPYRSVASTLIDALEVRGLDGRRIGLEMVGYRNGLTLADVEAVRLALPAASFADIGGPIAELRRTKSPREIEYLRTANQITIAGLENGINNLRPGMTERQLYGLILSGFYLAGADGHWFAIQSGARGMQVRDGVVSDLPLQRGHFAKLDGGAHYRGYQTDICRMVSLGQPGSPQARSAEISTRANAAALAATRAGVRILDVAAAADAEIPSGYTPYWNAIGHGMGLTMHEHPFMFRDSEVRLFENEVISIEVGVCDDARFEDGSFTFEDNMLVTATGVDVFSTGLPTELIIV